MEAKKSEKESGRSLFNVRKTLQSRKSETKYDEYLMAMKRVHHRHSLMSILPTEIETPRERHRKQSLQKPAMDVGQDNSKPRLSTMSDAKRVGIIASMVPDEIIYKHYDYSSRSYEAALMFCDVSGFTELCEQYTTRGRGGPSRLTQVLNSYIGAMVQEVLTHNGDVLKFSGDAFLSMWKKTANLSMQEVVHNAIDCGLIIQKNYGTFTTDIGIVLKVKVAISAGMSEFSIIGDSNTTQKTSFVVVGQPVWDVKMAQYMTKSGDVLAAASAWIYVNEAEYCTQPCGDGRHTKVLGVGASWKRVEKLNEYKCSFSVGKRESEAGASTSKLDQRNVEDDHAADYKEFSLRPAVIEAMRSSWWPGLRNFMVPPVLRAVDNDEPMDFLTEVRRVVVVFLNIITKPVTPRELIEIVDTAYKIVSRFTSKSGGLVNKVSTFDKDMMFLVVFGLRGMKHEDEAQHALLCASQLKENLVHDDIISVSIGVTSGKTYCGVVGHVLRREYTVIGPAVNKAARLMMTYPDKVSCDKETFLRSKLEQEYFRQLEAIPLKGIAKPGPIYEFNNSGWPRSSVNRPVNRHPILGRNEELRKFKMTLQNALEQQNKNFTRYRDHKYAIVFAGPKMIGKTRLVEECLAITPDFVVKEKLILSENDEVPYFLFRHIMNRHFRRGSARNVRENNENKIRYCINMMDVTSLQIYAINTIFDCRFPLPETFQYDGDLLGEFAVKTIVQDICRKVLTQLWVMAVVRAEFVDNESWRLLLFLLETKMIFFILSIDDMNSLSTTGKTCLSNNMVVTIPLTGIARNYHAALACQLLDVQAIPTDLEKVIESASGGIPGWIQNFVISLVQRGALNIVSVTRSEAQKEPGIVMPTNTMLQKADLEFEDESSELLGKRHSFQSIYSMISMGAMSAQDNQSNFQENDVIQMAVLAENYTFNDLNVDMTMDAMILKTYDSLTPFEKMLLKCGSVLGDVFSRRMLMNLLQSDSPRKVAQAVAKLYRIRVLECEGGDFTRDTSLVLVHPAPALYNLKPPYCACLGTRQPANCRDLPMYAFCGYMKFRHSLFRTTTYDLLTESQKHEMHTRALLYLERYTRRCANCGAGCFTTLLGLRCDDGLIEETEELKRTRLQICAISAEARMAGEEQANLYYTTSATTSADQTVPDSHII